VLETIGFDCCRPAPEQIPLRSHHQVTRASSLPRSKPPRSRRRAGAASHRRQRRGHSHPIHELHSSHDSGAAVDAQRRCAGDSSSTSVAPAVTVCLSSGLAVTGPATTFHAPRRRGGKRSDRCRPTPRGAPLPRTTGRGRSKPLSPSHARPARQTRPPPATGRLEFVRDNVGLVPPASGALQFALRALSDLDPHVRDLSSLIAPKKSSVRPACSSRMLSSMMASTRARSAGSMSPRSTGTR
jgi:hypothetical protein